MRKVAALVLLAVAVTWPFLDVGPRGTTILSITRDHGVDIADFAAVIPLALAFVLVRPRRRSGK